MKKAIISIILIALVTASLTFAGCVRVDLAEKNGPITTNTYNNIGFTGIDIGNAFELTVTQSANYSITVTAGQNVMEHIKIHQDGSLLVFEIDSWVDVWWSNWYNPKVAITMPDLTELNLTGASQANVSGFESDNNFRLYVSGASEIDMDMTTGDFFTKLSGASRVSGSLTATKTDIELSGASRIKLSGSGGDITLEGSGASDAELKNYTGEDASIDFSGASHANLNVSGRLDVQLRGASSLDYYGNPTMGNIDTSGASSINHKTAP
jgi:hypothetical protein